MRSADSEQFTTIHTFSGATKENDWLIYTPETPLSNVAFVRIQTNSSPSWIAWKEIEVLGEME